MWLILIFHICTGAISVISGAMALFARKGSKLHRAAGNVFFLSILAMAVAGAIIAFRKPEMITFLAGIFTCYLVATSWMTIKRAEKRINLFDYSAPVIALLIGAACVTYGLEAMNNESGLKDGFSSEPYFFFGGLSLLAAALDVNVLIHRGIVGIHRIARHLWRMCLALYFAAGSAFTGPGAQAFPESIRGTTVLSVPENLVAVLTLFWLILVLSTNQYRNVH